MEFSTNFWWDLLDVAIFSSIGIILMLLGNFLIDLIIPCSFPEEIKKRNKSVGFVSAGINIPSPVLGSKFSSIKISFISQDLS